MHRDMLAAADEAEDVILDLKPLLEGRSILVVMMALGELLAATLSSDRLSSDAREAFLRSVIGRASDMAGHESRLH
jgi:hypothetical protein